MVARMRGRGSQWSSGQKLASEGLARWTDAVDKSGTLPLSTRPVVASDWEVARTND